MYLIVLVFIFCLINHSFDVLFFTYSCIISYFYIFTFIIVAKVLTGTGKPRTRGAMKAVVSSVVTLHSSSSRYVHSEVTNNKSDVAGIATSDSILGSSKTTAGFNTERVLRSSATFCSCQED